MRILRKLWTKDEVEEEVRDVYGSYVVNLRNRVSSYKLKMRNILQLQWEV